ncbi:CBN-ATG-2 protein [Caenorhabditis brenneri]|uniref:Autophagy-related protein 2 n=1 Tax=Caenorhabditis brenneri TaxID=135651 RepID=G0P2H5_CAEBE|nr:CBN-ATG-2 protein [Caenorhabditis brenneri]
MDGYIGKIRVEIPWLSLLSESASICVEDLQLVVKGARVLDVNNLESVASMIGSVLMGENDLNMADSVFEEISKRNNFSSVFLSNDNTAETLLGFINAVQSKFRLTIKNLTLRFENVPSEGATMATAVEVHIQNVSFEDIDKTSNSMFNLNKEFKFSGVSVHTDVFSSIKTEETTFSKAQKEPTSLFVKKDSADQKSEATPMQSSVQPESDLYYSCYDNCNQLETTLSDFKLPSAPIKCAELVGDVSVVFRTKNESNADVNKSQIEAEVDIGAAHIFATASQLEIIKRCFCALLSAKKEAHAEDKTPITEEGYEIILNLLERKTTQENSFPEECQSVENSFCEFKNTRMHENVKKEFRIGIKIGTFVVFIPHFDYLASNNADRFGGFAQALENLAMKSDRFFTSIQSCSIASKRGISEFQDQSYPENHLRMVGNSIKITSSFGNGEEFLCETVAEQLSILEYLTPESVPGQSAPLKVNIFKFSQEESIENTPNFKMILKKALGKGNAEVDVFLGPVRTELDFSTADRLSSLIICKPFFDAAPNRNCGTSFVEVSHLISNIGADIKREQQSETIVNVKCSKWRVDLRIPNNTSKKEADFSHTQRNVYDELFHFGFKEVDISIPIRTEVSAVHILSTAIYGDFFGEKLKIPKEQQRIFYAVGNESTKIDMKLMFKKKEYVIDKMAQQPGSSGIYQNINSSVSEDFSSVYLQREGPFSKTSRSYCSGEETKEIVQAGSRKEIHEFQEKCEMFASTHLLINIPTLKLHIPAKNLLEVLYNRVVNDLASFELSAPIFAMPSNPTKTFAYYEARDSSNFENANQSTVKTLRGSHFNREALHSFVMTLNVEKAAVVCNTTEASQVALDLEKVHIGTTSGYHGDKDHTYFHFTSTKIAAGFSENSRISNILSSKNFGKWSKDCSQLETVSSTDELSSGSTEDAISIALHIQSKPARNERDIVLGTAVRNTHLLAKPIKNFDEFWISQLADLFTLQDYTDDELPAISTDVHVCFDNVIIGYDHSWINSESRLKLRAVLGNCFVATSITPKMEILKAICVLQNCQLLMKDEKGSVQIERHNKAKTCSKKFVNVATLGSLQLDVSLGLGDSRTHPKFEIRCQNDVLSAWVCADSLATLTNTVVEYMEHVEFNSKMQPIEDVESKGNIGESTWSYASTRSRRTQKMNATSELPDYVQRRLETMIEEAVNYTDNPVEFEEIPTTKSEPMKNRNATSHGGITDKQENTEDDFCFVQHTELRRSTAINPEESSVREFLSGSSLKTNFFDCTNGTDGATNDTRVWTPIFKYFVTDVTFRLCLYAGNDLSEAPSPIKSYSTKEFQNGCGPGQKIEANSSGGTHRDHSAFIVLELNKVTFDKKVFDKTAPHLSTTVFQIDDIVIKDCVKASKINEMLYQYSVSLEPKRSSTPLFCVRISENKASGGNMRVSMQPIKVNMDQDTLEFLSDFIDETSRLLKLKKNQNSSSRLPLISVPRCKNTEENWRGTSLIKQDMLLRSSMMESVHPCRKEEHSFDSNGQIEDYGNFLNDIDDDDEFVKQRTGKDFGDKENEIVSDDQTFFKHFVFSPSIKVYVDYFGKRKMNIEKTGSFMGIIMAFGQLNRMPITLRKINTRIGLLGFESCLSHAVNEWTKEMVKHIPSYIESIGPIRPLVQIGKGVRDLCQMPLSELNKSDGSLLKGLQKGVGAFGVSSAASVIGMAQTVTGCVQSLAEMALQENTPDVCSKRKTSGYYNETIPSDVQHSLQLAYGLLQDTFQGKVADQQSTAPKKRATPKSAVQNAFEYAVPAILGPIALASQVTNQILGGMKSQLRPDSYHDKNRKYGGK